MSWFQALLMASDKSLFVSMAGSGDETGRNPAHAMAFADFLLETITVNTHIYFNRGDTFPFEDYDFSVRAHIGAYGSGADPIADSSEDISGLTWTDTGGGIYTASVASEPKWIWINGVCAKNASTSRINVQARNNTTTATVGNNTLDLYTDIIGSYLVIKEKNFQNSQRVTITNFVAATDVITFDGEIPTGLNVDLVVYNDTEFFAGNNEWVWRSGTLYVMAAASPSTMNIRKTDATYGIKSTANLSVDNFEFKNYYTAAIWMDGGVPRVSNCSFHDIKDVGVLVQRPTTGTLITDNTFERIGNVGVLARPLTDSHILRNTFTDIGMQANYNWQTWFDGDGSLVINNVHGGGNAIAMFVDYDDDTEDGLNATVEYNTITNVAYRGISLGLGTQNTIRFNIVTDFCNRYIDGGGIYIYHYRAYDLPQQDTEIAYNIVSNNNNQETTFGIYLDNGSFETYVHHNTIYDCTFPTAGNFSGGIFCGSGGTDATVEYNNIRGCDYGIIFRIRDPSSVPAGHFYADLNVNNQMNFNNIAARREDQKALYFGVDYSNPTWNPFSGTGGADNNHYTKVVGNLYVADSDNQGNDLTLAALQAAYGEDASSVQVPETSDLIINPTNAISNEDGTGYYTDLDGNPVTTYTIDPYYSRLLAEVQYSNQLVAASSQYYNAGTTSDIQFNSSVDFSISFWIKYAANPGANQIVLSNINGSTRGYDFVMLTTGVLRFNCISTPSTSLLVLSSTSDIADNTWHHVLAVKRTSAALSKMYVDGVDVTTIVTNNLTTSIASTHDLYIGAITGPTQYADMLIDNVAIWNVNMNANAAMMYNAGRIWDYRNFTGTERPIHYWKMGLPDNLLDVGTSASPLNLTAVNGPTSSTDTP